MEAQNKTSKVKEPKEFNPVHLDTIHTENIKKERKYEGKNFKYDYTFNPKYLYPYAEKPCLISPSRPFTSNDSVKRQSKREYKLNRDPVKDAFIHDRISKIIKQNQQIPKDKYEYPITSSQEIGCYSQPLVDNSRWNYPVSATPISKYVDNYFITMHINPFKMATSSIKLK